jgi:hypothetical protein
MDPLSITVSITALLGFSGQCISTIARFRDVKNIDQRIDAFHQDLLLLHTNLESLDDLCKRRAQSLEKVAEDCKEIPLWKMVQNQLACCKSVLHQIQEELNTIESSQGALHNIIKYTKASLKDGMLSSLRANITLISTSLGLPLQMLAM